MRGSSLLLLALTLTLPGTASSTPALFPDRVDVAPQRPADAVRADFDLDGHADLAIAGLASGYVAVFFGKGDGTFDEVRLELTSSMAVATGDFDEDGLPDLVATGGPNEQLVVSVWLGNGDRGFATPATYHPMNVPICPPAGQCGPVPCPFCYLRTIDVGDIDADGHADLVVGDSKWTYSDVAPPLSIRGGHTILFGDGTGGFGRPADLRGGSGELCGIGDFDGDPHLDLVVDAERCFGSAACSPLPALDVWRGNGDGTFVPAGQVPGTGGACDIAVLDDDGNGLDDVAATVGTELLLARSSGGGGFLPTVHYGVGLAACRIERADFDSDGAQEFVLGSASRAVSLFPDRRSGIPDAPRLIPTVHRASHPVAADFAEDGTLDLAIASHEEGTLAILRGRGDGTFERVPRRHDFAVGGVPTGLAIADIDLDGSVDVVATHAPSTLSVLLGDRTGGLAPAVEIPVGSAPRAVGVGRLSWVDFYPDLVVLNQTDASALLGIGFPTFVEVRTPLEPNPTAMVLADFSSDGLADLAVSHGSPTNLVTVRLARGDGTFSGARAQPVGSDPRDLATHDIDGDGRLDLVTANHASGDVSILRSAPFGAFLAEIRVPVGGSPEFVAGGDLDRDGRSDLVVSQGQIVVLHGNGDGTFGAAVPLDHGDNYRNAGAIVDLDEDGRPDLAGWGAKSNTATALLGNGALSFAAHDSFGVPGEPRALDAGDLDDDGRFDLVLGTGDALVSVLVNQGPATIGFGLNKTTLAWPFEDGAAHYEVYRGALAGLLDADGDGLPDAGYGDCQDVTDPERNHWDDGHALAPGAGAFYLVATVDAQGLRDLGTTSAGLARVPGTVCP